MPQVEIYTDGGCEPNPGPGGYGAVLMHPRKRAEASGGFRLTTNHRMEILARSFPKMPKSCNACQPLRVGVFVLNARAAPSFSASAVHSTRAQKRNPTVTSRAWLIYS